MIGNPPGQEAHQQRKPMDKGPTDETVYGGAGPEETVTVGDRIRREAEISRLTWVVLDGKASVADRQRLAKLVSAQHELRRA